MTTDLLLVLVLFVLVLIFSLGIILVIMEIAEDKKWKSMAGKLILCELIPLYRRYTDVYPWMNLYRPQKEVHFGGFLKRDRKYAYFSVQGHPGYHIRVPIR